MDDSKSSPSSANAATELLASTTSKARKPPRWTIAFLRALERTGQVRSAAVDAGVDYTSAYARRRAHPEFDAAWQAALAARSVRVAAEERGAIEALQCGAPSPGSPLASPPSPAGAEGPGAAPLARGKVAGAEYLSSTALGGAQYKRCGAGRWSPAAERRFFDELAATANVTLAAVAAGVSPNAVRARREKRPLFRAQWEAVLANARANIELGLVSAAERRFDPAALNVEHVEPRVTVAEAIRIVQLHGSKRQKEETDYFAEQAAKMSEDDIVAIRQRLVDKLQRLKWRDMPDQLAAGWSYDEARDTMIPPGWVRAAPGDEAGGITPSG